MKLDPVWIEEAAKTSFELWERHRSELDKEYQPRTWEAVTDDGKAVWRSHMQQIAEMAIEFTLIDAWHFFNASGDLGGALVRALQRFAFENFHFEIQP